MHAKEQTLKQLLEGEKQYVVPLYQRTYAWQRPQLEALWSDLMLQVEALATSDDAPGHFLGSLVLAPSRQVVGGATRWLVVDGQQRLTSLSLALSALRDHVRSENPKAAERIHRQFLINEYQEGLEMLKVLPTQDDRHSFHAVVLGDPGEAVGNIGDAYRVFRELMAGFDDPDNPEDMHQVELALVSRLDLVAITTDADDNVHRIFQSLNNTGMQLTQGDLLRNHYFMLLPTTADRIYIELWRPMEKSLGVENLETLAYVDLLLNGFERANRGDTYRLQAERIRAFEKEPAAVEADIERLARRATALMPVLDPESAPSEALITALARLREWGVEATQVVLLAAMERLQAGTMTEEQVLAVARLCESFLVRRMLTGRSAAGLNRILAETSRLLLRADEPVDDVHAYLSGPRRGWASDAQLREGIQTRSFYWMGKASQRRFVLRALEESLNHKEPVDWTAAKPQIEHVMPQTLTGEWESTLKDPEDPTLPAVDVHAKWVHRLGNLTLTSYNSELSNAPFASKKQHYAASHFEMTKRVAQADVWGPEAIQARADRLTDRAIEIWPAPLEQKQEVTDRWKEVRQVLATLPEGMWTSYGDVAAVTGTHPVPLGQYLATSELPNAWRVLNAHGEVAEGFRWTDGRDADPVEVLEAEGVQFDDRGRADEASRLRPEDLAELLGIETDGAVPGGAGVKRGRDVAETFWKRFRIRAGSETADELASLVEAWTKLGGTTSYSVDPILAMYFTLPETLNAAWLFGVFPQGKGTVEVPFQYMKAHPPFDDSAVRDEIRRLLNQADGIDLPAARLGLRPRFKLRVVENAESRAAILEAMRFFIATADEYSQETTVQHA